MVFINDQIWDRYEAQNVAQIAYYRRLIRAPTFSLIVAILHFHPTNPCRTRSRRAPLSSGLHSIPTTVMHTSRQRIPH